MDAALCDRRLGSNEGIVKRAERAGCPTIAFTVDNMPGRNNETLLRAMREDKRDCTTCHVNNSHNPLRRSPMYEGLDVGRVKELSPSALSWDYLDRLRDLVSVKLLIKGIVTGEDAAGCVEHGADGIIVSNHGGRNEETLHASIACLPEVAAAGAGRVPVLVDGGVRRGTDVFKALALGATAVGIGRPQAWGLAAFGQKGVEAVLAIYDRELRVIMRQAGTPTQPPLDLEASLVTLSMTFSGMSRSRSIPRTPAYRSAHSRKPGVSRLPPRTTGLVGRGNCWRRSGASMQLGRVFATYQHGRAASSLCGFRCPFRRRNQISSISNSNATRFATTTALTASTISSITQFSSDLLPCFPNILAGLGLEHSATLATFLFFESDDDCHHHANGD